MAIQARAADYNSDARTPKTGRPPAWRPADAKAVDEFLQLLARSIQQFHTYPPTSSMCQNAVEACKRALVLLDGREHVAFRITPRELVVDDVTIGRGTLIEQELARRLHAAAIAEVTVDRAASARELSRFCHDLVGCGERNAERANLIELLTEHGVDRIALRPSHRPEVLQVGAPAPPVQSLIEHQRAVREDLFATGGSVNHLYPPDKGWVRVDPSSRLENVSLVDLALLADEPAALATMLLRLTDEDADEGGDSGSALTQKFSDVTTLFGALDPRVARMMFSKLAHAVLELNPDRRQNLLRRTILPGLLDGRIDGTVLKDFPDLDLAESLCLLLDLETAAPEVVTTALARLDLPADRQASVMPLLEERLQERGAPAGVEASLDAHARKLVRIDRSRAASYAEFAAFDLALDEHTADALGQIRDDIGATDLLVDQLECLWKLAHIEPNPEVVERFLNLTTPLLEDLERQERWPEFTNWLVRYRNLASELRETRPDVAEVIERKLSALCTPARAARIVDLAERDGDRRALAAAVITALGAGIGAALLNAVHGRTVQTRDAQGRGAVQLLCDHAKLVAPALVHALPPADDAIRRLIVRVLGFAGPGHEPVLAPELASRDEQVVREALRSLARIGTPRAAAVVIKEIEKPRGWIGGAAEQTLWHFPRGETERQIRELLSRSEFVARQPQTAIRMLERAAQAGTRGLEPALTALTSLRFRFWNPALARVGRKARAMLRR